MSRARELAKAGGVQQRIAGFSSHVGMSTFLAAVHMENNLTVDGNASVGGNLTVTGTTTFNGGTLTLGDANTDNVVFGGEVDSNIIPDDDNSFDLGSSSKEWKDLYVDGVAYLDSVESDGGSFGNIQVGETGDNEIDTGSGNLTIDSAGGTVTVDDNLTVAGTVTFNTALTNGNLANSAVTVTAGDGLTGGGSISLGGSATLNVQVDDSSIETNSDTLRVKASGVTNAMLAGSIANGKLANSTVSYGGVSLSLGGSDATPAFDLQDATGYPTSSLTGTITNAQLAGSIANGKLSNSSVSFGGVSLSLGGSDGTPAFDLSDATNYPTSSLSGTITNAQLAGSIANSKLSTISTANKVSISALNIDGGTDINAALVDADEIIVDDGGGGTNRRCDMSRVKTYIYGAMSGDATAGSGGAVTLAASGVSAATYGSATAIPQITVDAKGRITSATTNNVNTTTNLGKSTATGQITITSSTGDNVVIGEATASIAGLMSTTHHDKLDGIESGATADQTASEILTLIKTVDGSGSGLDADTLDGISSASFLRSDTSDTFSGTLTVSGNILPNANGTRDLGASGTRWANVYSSDLDLSNEAKGGNTIDGSWGSYLIEEGEEHLYLTNRRSGKKYKFMLEEV